MSLSGYDPHYSSIYKRRVTTHCAGYGGTGGGIGFKTAYSSHAAPITSYGSSRRGYPTHSHAISSYSSMVLSSPAPAAAAELQISQAAQVSGEFKALRTQEKAELQDLNDRFANFIERVHELEQQNKLLETELLLLRQRQVQPSNLRSLYDNELCLLRAAVEEAQNDKHAAQKRRDEMQGVLHNLQKRYEEEVHAREDEESRMADAKRGVDEAALGQAELEKKVANLLEGLNFLKRLCESEIAELQAQLQFTTEVSVEMEIRKPNLSSALRDIRVQYEKTAQGNLQAAEDWFSNKMNVMMVDTAHDNENARNARDEAGEYRRLLKAKTLEVDSCREMNQALENQLQEVEEKQSADIAAMQATINQLEDELRASKHDMARHMRDYQDLLNVKMSLDIEIAAYRKLLEGEECRFNVQGPYPVLSQSLYATQAHGRIQVSTQPRLSAAVPYLLSSRLCSTPLIKEETISATHLLQAEANPPEEEEDQGEEEEVEGEEVEAGEEEAEAEAEEVEEVEGEEGDEQDEAEGEQGDEAQEGEEERGEEEEGEEDAEGEQQEKQEVGKEESTEGADGDEDEAADAATKGEEEGGEARDEEEDEPGQEEDTKGEKAAEKADPEKS